MRCTGNSFLLALGCMAFSLGCGVSGRYDPRVDILFLDGSPCGVKLGTNGSDVDTSQSINTEAFEIAVANAIITLGRYVNERPFNSASACVALRGSVVNVVDPSNQLDGIWVGDRYLGGVTFATQRYIRLANARWWQDKLAHEFAHVIDGPSTYDHRGWEERGIIRATEHSSLAKLYYDDLQSPGTHL